MAINDVDELLQRVRTDVLRLVEAKENKSNDSQWEKTLKFLDYILELSPARLKQIRLHTELLTGESLVALWHGTFADPESAAEGLGYILGTENMPARWQIGEPPASWALCGKLGVEYQGRIINQ